MMIGILVCLIILVIVALPWWCRYCESEENMLEMRLSHDRHIAEIKMCYGSEQSFLEIKDDAEHMASITPAVKELADETA